jgi:hypothetical protein
MRLNSIRRWSLNKFVWLDHVLRIDPYDGLWAGPNVHLWRIDAVRRRQVVLSNISTGHVVELDASNIRQFDYGLHGMPEGADGAFELRSPVVLSGCNAFKSYEAYLMARRTRPQIFLPVTITSPIQLIQAVTLANRASLNGR